MTKIKTILVDDEPRGLTSLQKLLEMNCDEVEVISCCGSAAEAKEKIAQLHPQLVFLELFRFFPLFHNQVSRHYVGHAGQCVGMFLS